MSSDPTDRAEKTNSDVAESTGDAPSDNPADVPPSYNMDDVFVQLERLEATVSSEHEQREVERMRRMLEHVPGGNAIRKYTTRDIGEAFVGGILFSLPLLVEDGVFEIAEWFTEVTLGPIPVFLVLNVVFIVALTTGLLYAIDFREIRIYRPLFGIIPRRLVGILIISLLVAAGSMLLWGRLHADDPTTLEVVARITVIWAAAALGAVLADILPGESKGEDISTLIGDSE